MGPVIGYSITTLMCPWCSVIRYVSEVQIRVKSKALGLYKRLGESRHWLAMAFVFGNKCVPLLKVETRKYIRT